jgi:hypothetical protein
MNPKPAGLLAHEMSQLDKLDSNLEQIARRQIINELLKLKTPQKV